MDHETEFKNKDKKSKYRACKGGGGGGGSGPYYGLQLNSAYNFL